MGEQARSSHESRDYLHSLHRILQIGIERACRPWLLNDFAFGLSALGRENRRCVASLHDFTNRVIRDRRRSLQRAAGDADDASDAPSEILKSILKRTRVDDSFLFLQSNDWHFWTCS